MAASVQVQEFTLDANNVFTTANEKQYDSGAFVYLQIKLGADIPKNQSFVKNIYKTDRTIKYILNGSVTTLRDAEIDQRSSFYILENGRSLNLNIEAGANDTPKDDTYIKVLLVLGY